MLQEDSNEFSRMYSTGELGGIGIGQLTQIVSYELATDLVGDWMNELYVRLNKQTRRPEVPFIAHLCTTGQLMLKSHDKFYRESIYPLKRVNFMYNEDGEERIWAFPAEKPEPVTEVRGYFLNRLEVALYADDYARIKLNNMRDDPYGILDAERRYKTLKAYSDTTGMPYKKMLIASKALVKKKLELIEFFIRKWETTIHE
jgi:hypothetical protein